MAFPTIADADTQNGTVAANSTSWTLTYPTNVVSGDLLLCFLAVDGSSTVTASGWSAVNGTSAAISLAGLLKIADGTETGTFVATISGSEQGGWRIFRVTGWFGSGLQGGSWVVGNDGVGMGAANAASATSTPDPPSCNPAQWDVEDTLWFAVCSLDTSRTISVYPYVDRNTADVSGGANGATLGVCTTTSATASLDPGTFTISASDDWIAITVAIRPAAVVAVPYYRPYPQLLAQ